MQCGSVTYTGSAGVAKSITGFGFAPAAVMIFNRVNQGICFKVLGTSTRTGQVYVTNLGSNLITSLDADGFSIGTTANFPNATGGANNNLAIAFSDDSSAIDYGEYTGNGGASQVINRNRTFAPGMLHVGPVSGGASAAHRHINNTGNQCHSWPYVGLNFLTTFITAMSTTTFTVGSNLNVNSQVYMWMAIRNVVDTFHAGQYTKTGATSDNRDITVPGWTVSPNHWVHCTGLRESINTTGAFWHDRFNPGDSANNYLGVYSSDAIQSVSPGIFQVGNTLNTALGGTATYWWYAVGGGVPPATPLISPLPSDFGKGVSSPLPMSGYTKYKTMRQAVHTFNNLNLKP